MIVESEIGGQDFRKIHIPVFLIHFLVIGPMAFPNRLIFAIHSGLPVSSIPVDLVHAQWVQRTLAKLEG